MVILDAQKFRQITKKKKKNEKQNIKLTGSL